MARNIRNQGQLDGIVQNWFPNGGAGDRPGFVVVVDVGQGNCNVVFSLTGTHLVYYDVGGAVLGSLFTYPRTPPSFCVAAATKFLLSHWDEDHYESLYYIHQNHPNTLANTEWLAPDQSPGAAGWRAAIQKSVSSQGTENWLVGQVASLDVWPDEQPLNAAVLFSENGNFRVIKVEGSNSNNHALALRVKRQGANEFILLTGDAEYEANTFNHLSDQLAADLVASHHGSAVVTPGDIPRPLGAASRIAFSYGDGNQYCHPFQTGINAYVGRQWEDPRRFDTAGAPCESRRASPRGNVGLMWPNDTTGGGLVQAPGQAQEVNEAAVALLAAAAAEIEVHQAGFGQGRHVAVGAAYQGAREAGSVNVAAAMVAPAVMLPAQTLAQVAANQGVVAAALTNALGVVAAQAANAANANRQDLARTVVDAVFAGWSRLSWAVAAAVEASNQFQALMAVQTRSAQAAKEARDVAARRDSRSLVEATVTAALGQAVTVATNTRGRGAVPTLAELRTDMGLALTAAASAVIGNTGGAGNRKATPFDTAAVAVAAMGTVSATLRAAIGAAVATAPMIPIGPNTLSPGEATDNPHAKRLMRVATVAALIGEENGGSASDSAQAAAVAARVALPAAHGAQLVGCHRHPRTCANPVCSLSIHLVAGMMPGFITTHAGSGNAGSTGNPAVATVGELHTPAGLALDAARNLYVADPGSHKIRKVDAAGNISTVAGTGNQGYGGDAASTRLAARFDGPTYALYVRPQNAVFIADTGNHRIRKVDLATGVVTTVAGDGNQGHQGDGGAATSARLNGPQGLAYYGHRNRLYVADTGNHCIRRVELSTGTISTVAGTPGTAGSLGDGGQAPAGRLSGPRGVAVDGAENVYVADTGNHAVRQVSNLGVLQTLANTAFNAGHAGDGFAAANATLNGPTDVAVNPLNEAEIFVVDCGNHCIRRIDGNNDIDTVAGTINTAGATGDGAAAANARFRNPTGMVFDDQGDYYVADTGNHTIRAVDLGTATGDVTRIGGTVATSGNTGDNAAATNATLDGPCCPAFDGLGNLYIPDTNNHRLRMLDTNNDVDAWAGTGVQGFLGDSAAVATAADLDTPSDVAVDLANNRLFIADTTNHRIRQVDLASGRISTIVGTGVQGGTGDNGAATAARLNGPRGLAYDPVAKALYVADTGNHRVRRVDLEWGLIYAAAGNGTQGFQGDTAAAANARLDTPIGLAVGDVAGAAQALFIADSANRCVRKVVLATGVITTIVNTGRNNGNAGDGGGAAGASMAQPVSVALDGQGQLYVADAGHHRVRRVDLASGTIFAAVASGTQGFLGDGGPPLAARMDAPRGVVVDRAGLSIFVSDTASHRVRRACP